MDTVDVMKEKLERALEKPFFYDRVTALDEIEKSASWQLASHNVNKNDTTSEEIKFFGKGLLLTVAVTTGACFAFGLLGVAAGIAGVATSAIGVICYERSGKAKTKACKKYEEVHGAEMAGLSELKKVVKVAQNKELDEFNALPLDQKAGVRNLHDLVDICPEVRHTILQIFRESAGKPTYEQTMVKRDGLPSSHPAP